MDALPNGDSRVDVLEIKNHDAVAVVSTADELARARGVFEEVEVKVDMSEEDFSPRLVPMRSTCCITPPCWVWKMSSTSRRTRGKGAASCASCALLLALLLTPRFESST